MSSLIQKKRKNFRTAEKTLEEKLMDEIKAKSEEKTEKFQKWFYTLPSRDVNFFEIKKRKRSESDGFAKFWSESEAKATVSKNFGAKAKRKRRFRKFLERKRSESEKFSL